MTKRVGLWTLATLLVAGVAMGTYMYSHGGKTGSCPFSSCPVTDTKSEESTFSYTTLSTDNSKTVSTDSSDPSSCCSGQQEVASEKLDASAYTSLSTQGIEQATLNSGKACTAEVTPSSAKSEVAKTDTIALADK